VFVELAQMYAGAGHPKAAAILYRQIHRQAMTTPEFASDTRVLLTAKYGNALVADGQADAALAMYKASLARLEAQPGLDDEGRLKMLGFAANAARAKGDLAEAEALLERARDLAERSDERDSMGARAVYHNLASLYLERGRRDRYDEAERLLEHNAAIIARASGRESADYAGTLGQLANVVEVKGELERAEPLFRESFRAYESARDAKPEEFADFLTGAGFVYLRLHRPAEAVAVFRRARDLRAAIPGLGPVALANTVSHLALACFESGALPEAIQWYREAIEVRHGNPEFVAAAA
jgi:tetratricopeptide (TPR) repeat protein